MQQSRNATKDFRTALLLILVLVLVWGWMSVVFLGLRPWSSRGEPREALVTQSMFQSENYVLGEGYGGVVPSKPPLLHWSAVALSKINGSVSEFTMRAPSAIAALLVLLVTFALSRSFFPTISPLLAPLLLASSLEFFRSGIEARVDMVLCAAMFGAVISLWRFLDSNTFTAIFLNALAGSALLAIAILAKGPVGLVLPCGALTTFWWFTRKSYARPFLLLIPGLIGLSIAAIWYWEAYQVGGAQFFERVKYENVLRFLGTQDDQPHKHSAFYLFAMLLVGLIPWVFVILSRVALTPRSWMKGVAGWYAGLPEGGKLLAWWSVIVFVFFCIPGSKRGVYLLPMYPALALLMAASLADKPIPWLSKTLGLIICLAGCLGVGLETGVFELVGVPGTAGSAISALSRIASSTPAVWIAHAALIGIGIALFLRSSRLRLVELALLFSLGLGGIHGGLLPLGAKWMSAKPFAVQVSSELQAHPANSLLSFGHEFYGLSFYLERKISRLEDTPAQVGNVILVYEDKRAELDALGLFRYEFVARSVDGIDEPFSRVLALRITELTPKSELLVKGS